MSEPAEPIAAAVPPGDLPVRRLYRSSDGRVLAGVAKGLADHLGVDVLWVRIAFVVLTAASGAGVVAYGLFWVFAPQSPYEPVGQPRERGRDLTMLLALGSLAVGLVLLLTALGLGLNPGLTVPLVTVVPGRRDPVAAGRRRRPGALAAGDGDLPGAGHGPGRHRAGARAAGRGRDPGRPGQRRRGVRRLWSPRSWWPSGIALVSGPWWVRMARDLTAERSARIREQERAEVAAHVHDSVLHTLTLIQRHVDDPREVARLARAQERELRGWLYRPAGGPGGYRAARRHARGGGGRGRGRARRRDRGRGRRRLPAGRAAGRRAGRRARGDGQRGEVRARARRLGLRRGRARAGHRLRPGPGAGLRPGRGARGPARPATVDHRPDGSATAARPTCARCRARAPRCSSRCRGARRDRPARASDRPADRRRGRAGRARRRPPDVPQRRAGRARRRRRGRRRGRGRRPGRHRHPGAPGPTWCCSTSTCPAAAGGPCSRRWSPSCRTYASSRCPCPTPPRTSSA